MYNFLKASHIIFIVAWFAALFYIFRLFVYHVQNKSKPDICNVFETMERKLIRIIMAPAMVLTLATGIWMLAENPDLIKMGWIHAKLTLIFSLLVYHHFAMYVRRKFELKQFFLSEKACRYVNEVPTLILIGVVFLAILKPF